MPIRDYAEVSISIFWPELMPSTLGQFVRYRMIIK